MYCMIRLKFLLYWRSTI